MLNDANENEGCEKRNGVRDHADSEMQYGWFRVRPACMQVMLKPVMCLLVLVGCTSTQVMIANILPAVERTLRTRYKLTEKDVSGLNVAQGISLMIAVILIGFFGSFRQSKIRCIAAGMLVSGVGAIFFSIPHFNSEAYEPLDHPKQALMMAGMCRVPQLPCQDESVKSSYMALFVIGHILIGLGQAPLFCLVPAYIDENIKPAWMPLAMLLWFANISVGPVVGMIVGGMFQQSYIDIDQPKLLHQLTPEDFRWLGAWWLGYIVFGVLTIFNAFIVAGFPPSLPGSQAQRDEQIRKGTIPSDDGKITRTPTGMLHATATLLKNKAFVFNTLAFTCIVFFFYSLGPFIMQILIIKYGTNPLTVLMPATIVLLFGLLVGIFLGGFFTYRIRLSNLAKGAAFLCFATQALCILAPLLFVIPGCNESNIAGVTKEYPAVGSRAMPMVRINASSEITAKCNKDCKCSTLFSQPVCGSNNVAYFDPCHAGCLIRPTEDDYTNCTCIPASAPGMKFGTAKKGFCDRGCSSWKIFLFVMFVALVIVGANIVPSRVVVLRCVQNNQRSYALAVQTFLYTLVEFIPLYLVRYIMDHDCNIWQKDQCGRKGICWDYDTNSMSKSMSIFGMVVTAIATTFYFFSWHTYEPPKTMKSNRLLSDTSAAPDDYDDGKETKL